VTADAHIHIFSDGFRGVLGASPAGGDELIVYEQLRAHYGIERALVVGYEGDQLYHSNNDAILALSANRPWMAALAYLPVTPLPSVASLRKWRARGAVGYSIYLSDRTEARAFDEWPRPIFSELCAQRALISINAPPESTTELHRSAEELGEGCAVLFSHLGMPGRYLAPPSLAEARARIGPLLNLARLAHVTVKVSGLYDVSDPPHNFPHETARPFVTALLESFGPDRMMWGSDFPAALDFVSFVQTTDIRALQACSQRETEAVMGGNLLALLAVEQVQS
jgi:predicted TIM-barrel fold metal-dependent hydrolase